MEKAVEKLRAERRRKLQVREAFARGLEHFRHDCADPVPFYLACADYLVAGQRRLIEQDLRLAAILEPRIPAGQQQDHEAIAALRGRLSQAERALAAFAAGAAALRHDGSVARARFEAAAADFLHVLVNVLGARSHSLRHLTSTLLTEADWEVIADVTPAASEAESALFAAVQAKAPEGLDPGAMPTEVQRR